MAQAALLAPFRLRHALAAGLVLWAGGLFAQDNTGGVIYSFGIDQSLRSESNPNLASPATAARLTSRTGLSFGTVIETRTQRLELRAQSTFVAGDAADAGDTGLIDPSVTFGYRLESAASQLGLQASLREREVDTLDFLLDTDDAGLPFITSVSGTGTQRLTGLGASYEFGRDAALGGSLAFNRAETDYIDTTDPTLIDSARNTARLNLRLALNEATRLTAGLSVSRLQEVDRASSNTETYSFGLEHDRPDGVIVLEASLSDTETGQRESLRFGRSLELPAGELNARLGISSRTAGGSNLIGSLDWKQDLARSQLTLRLSQDITSDDSDTEIRRTQLTLGYTQDLSPSLTGNFGIGLQNGMDTASGETTRTANISASLRYALTDDWGLSAGATHRIRDADGTPRTESTQLTLSVSRKFDFRP